MHSGIILYTGFRVSKFVAYWPCNSGKSIKSQLLHLCNGVIREAASVNCWEE